MVLVGILLLDGVEIPQSEDMVAALVNNTTFKLAMNLINFSFIPYYLIVIVLIRYVHQIKYLYAALSVVIPVVAILLVTQLFTHIL